ncbi:MAG: hypothetical protein ACFFCV_21660 [Promethearchaeota archaeon]
MLGKFSINFITNKVLFLDVFLLIRYNIKKNNRSTLKFILSLFLLALFLVPIFRVHETNLSYNNFPHLSSSEILIYSPENKTYRGPMHGYYPATFGFENYEDGTTGLDIGFLNEYSGLGSGLNTDIRIKQALLDGHYNYLYIRDSHSVINTSAVHYIDNAQSIGTIEFFNRFNNNITGSATRREYVYFRASNNTIAFRMQINHHNGDLKYYNGTSYELISNVNADTWYNHKIIFNCNDGVNGTFTWIVREEDGTEISRVSNIDFENSFFGNTIDEIYFETEGEDYGLESMWDAFGFSWDSNYTIGTNLKEGLLLSFTNNTNLKWIGYSLDGMTNRTILGNIVIKFPEDGRHSIQIFGTASNGTVYTSEKIYFSINTENLGLNIPYIPIIIILSTVGVSVPVSYIIVNHEKKKKTQKKLLHKKGVGAITSLEKANMKKVGKFAEIPSIQAKIVDKNLRPIPQEIFADKAERELIVDEIDNYNLKMLKELCNEWIGQCAMHKESFEGLGYSCYSCHTNYCVKCAYTLAEKNIGCIVCGKLIPITFQKKMPKTIQKEETTYLHNIQNRLKNIFESEDLLVRINQLDEINLTFFDKDFFNVIEKLDLNENEKQLFIKEMQSLTPKERKEIIKKILIESNNSKINGNINNEFNIPARSEILEGIFKSENVMEKINEFKKTNLTFLEKDFFKKIENLELDLNEKQAFIKEMLSLTPEERNHLIRKLLKKRK